MQVNDRVIVRLATDFTSGEYQLESATITRVINDDLWHAVTSTGRKILISSEHIEAVV